MVGSTLVEAEVCKDAGGAFAKGAASLLQGSLELVTDAVVQTQDVLGYKVSCGQSFFFSRCRLFSLFRREHSTGCTGDKKMFTLEHCLALPLFVLNVPSRPPCLES